MYRRETISRYLCYGIIILLPFLLAISFKNTANILPLLFIMILVFSPQRIGKHILRNPLVYWFLAFFFYAVSSTLWAHAPEEALERMIKISLLILPVVCLLMTNQLNKHLTSDILLNLSLPVFMLASALLIFQLYHEMLFKDFVTGNTSNQYYFMDLNPAVTCLSILYWPLLALLENSAFHRIVKMIFLCALTAAVLSLLLMGHTDAARLSTLCGVAFFCLIRFGGRILFLKLFVFLSLIAVLLAPPFLYDRLVVKDYAMNNQNPYLLRLLEPSHLHRLEIWDRCIDLIKDKPLFGWGLAGSYNLPELEEPSRVNPYTVRSDFLYPHNVFIQCLVDFGIIGLMLFLLWLNTLINCIGQLPLSSRSAYAAALVAIITVYSFGFPLWRSWWIVFLCVIAVYWSVLFSAENSNSKT